MASKTQPTERRINQMQWKVTCRQLLVVEPDYDALFEYMEVQLKI